MGHLVLHDAHLPGPGQPGKGLKEGEAQAGSAVKPDTALRSGSRA